VAKYRLAQPARQDFDRILDNILEQEGRPAAFSS
jgi:plasmid stabilization system protein ParE